MIVNMLPCGMMHVLMWLIPGRSMGEIIRKMTQMIVGIKEFRPRIKFKLKQRNRRKRVRNNLEMCSYLHMDIKLQVETCKS